MSEYTQIIKDAVGLAQFFSYVSGQLILFLLREEKSILNKTEQVGIRSPKPCF